MITQPDPRQCIALLSGTSGRYGRCRRIGRYVGNRWVCTYHHVHGYLPYNLDPITDAQRERQTRVLTDL